MKISGGGQQTVVCPLCKLHPDGQEESFSCVKLKQIIELRGNYKEIFGWKFSPELIKTVHNVYSFREEYIHFLAIPYYSYNVNHNLPAVIECSI